MTVQYSMRFFLVIFLFVAQYCYGAITLSVFKPSEPLVRPIARVDLSPQIPNPARKQIGGSSYIASPLALLEAACFNVTQKKLNLSYSHQYSRHLQPADLVHYGRPDDLDRRMFKNDID